MKILAKKSLLLLVLLVASTTIPVRSEELPPQTDEFEERVEQLLRETGLKYTKAGSGVWVINRLGKSRGYFQVVLALKQNFLVVRVEVADKKSMPVTSEAALALLRLVNNTPFVKVALNDNEDLLVSAELWIKTLDVEQLKFQIENVASVADTTHQTLSAR